MVSLNIKEVNMSYQKKTASTPLDKLKFRIEALKSVNPDFDLGSGMEVTQLEQFESDLETGIDSYNTTLSDADDLRDSIRAMERRANDVSERLMASVIMKYGRDSLEYQRMGGTRKSEIAYTGSRPETYGDGAETSGNGQQP